MAASASVSPPNIRLVMLLGYVFAWKQISFLFALTLPALDFWIYLSTSHSFSVPNGIQFELAAAHPYTHFSMWWMLLFSLQLVNVFPQWIKSKLSPQTAVVSWVEFLHFKNWHIPIPIFFPFFFLGFFLFSNQFHSTVISLVKCLLCSTTYTLLGLFTKNLQSATCASELQIPKTIKPGFVLGSVIISQPDLQSMVHFLTQTPGLKGKKI